MPRLGRDAPLPEEMQGRWIVDGDPSSEFTVEGADATFLGAPIVHDWKDVAHLDGALTVEFGIDDESQWDTFNRRNIIGLVITPDGEFLGYNVKFGCAFTRPE